MFRSVCMSQSLHAKLRFIADQAGISKQAALELAIDRLYREHFLDACNRSYSCLMSDRAAATREFKERNAWDITLADGIAEP